MFRPSRINSDGDFGAATLIDIEASTRCRKLRNITGTDPVASASECNRLPLASLNGVGTLAAQSLQSDSICAHCRGASLRAKVLDESSSCMASSVALARDSSSTAAVARSGDRHGKSMRSKSAVASPRFSEQISMARSVLKRSHKLGADASTPIVALSEEHDAAEPCDNRLVSEARISFCLFARPLERRDNLRKSCLDFIEPH
mmetsp:Transcript_48747/g.76977  ORF Transcript_48747/g.76977 Transcript_48747/m.76977 type:complete len:203 (-) Transcript_48747:3202-3810(-)